MRIRLSYFIKRNIYNVQKFLAIRCFYKTRQRFLLNSAYSLLLSLARNTYVPSKGTDAMLTYEQAAAVEEQIPALRRYARALVRNSDRADDLVQDCLERAVSRFHQFQPGTNLRTWMFTILHNVHCDSLRRQQRRGIDVPIEEWERRAKTNANQPRAMEMRDFRRMFARLPKTDRQILFLIGVEGYSYEEASDSLEIAVGTVKSRLFRARERLRHLQDELNEPPTTSANWKGGQLAATM
jgi:RNA polymerase sigma-70 factor (ECF subfamily)